MHLNSKLRVLHLPGIFPFARKIASENIFITNENTLPGDIMFDWIAANGDSKEFLDKFDVAHIHTVEFSSSKDVESTCEKLKENHKGIVCTVHDTNPNYSSNTENFFKSYNTLKSYDAKFTTLTVGARNDISQKLGLDQKDVVVIPHGNVLDFNSPLWDEKMLNQQKDKDQIRFSMHGGFRLNKCFSLPIINFEFGMPENASLHFLTRAISAIELSSLPDVKDTIQYALQAKKINLNFHPSPSDEIIAEFTNNSDALLMPYKWGTHSGQLELAFDLSIKPVITNVGFYEDQYSKYKDFVPEPEWINWSDGKEYQYGVRSLQAMLNATNSVHEVFPKDQFKEFRIEERNSINKDFYNVYKSSLP